MTKEDLKRMMSLVDEKYIEELTKSEFSEDYFGEPAEVEHSIVQEAPPQRNGWRIFAALAAALVLCAPIGYGLKTGFVNMQPEDGISTTAVGMGFEQDWAAFVAEMSDEEIDRYIRDEFPSQEEFIDDVDFSKSYGMQTDAVPFARAYDGKFLWLDEREEGIRMADVMLTDDETGEMLSGERYLEVSVMHLEQYQQQIKENYASVSLPKFEDVAFYGFYTEWSEALTSGEVNEGVLGQCFFRYQDVEYSINCKGLSKRELLTVVYEVLGSGATPESLNELYQMEQANAAQNEFLTAAQQQLAELNRTGICTNLVPQLTQIGDMTFTSCAKPDTGDRNSYGSVGYHEKHNAEHSMGITYIPMISEYSESIALYPTIEIDDWSLETLLSEPYCTDLGNGLYNYKFAFEVMNCIIEVDAQCTSEEMSIWANAMYDMIADIYGFKTLDQYLADLNAVYHGWLPVNLREVGKMTAFSTGKGSYIDGDVITDNALFTYRDKEMYNHYLEVRFFAEDYKNTASFANPLISAEEWAQKPFHSGVYCTPRLELNGGNLNKYIFAVDWNDCIMTVEAQCSEEELAVFEQTMSNILEYKRFEEPDYYKEWKLELEEIGSMRHTGGSTSPESANDAGSYVTVEYTETDVTNHYLTVWYHPESYGELADFAFPMITADNWSEELLNTSAYRTGNTSPYRKDDKNPYNYQFAVDLGNCIMSVEAACTKEEMDIFAQAMAEKIKEKYSTVNVSKDNAYDAGTDNTDSGFHYRYSMEELRSLKFCKGWIPELPQIGELTFGMNGHHAMEGKEADATITWSEHYEDYKQISDHRITAAWYSKNYKTMDDFDYPVITDGDHWGMKTITSAPYCTELENGMNQYQLVIDWDDCIMTVDAQCTMDEICVFVDAMSELYNTKKTGISTPEYLTFEEANALSLCKGAVPQLETVGTLSMNGSVEHLYAPWVDNNTTTMHEFVNIYYKDSSGENKLVISYTDLTGEELFKSSEILSAADLTDTKKVEELLAAHEDDQYNFYFAVQCDGFTVRIHAEDCKKSEIKEYINALSDTLN